MATDLADLSELRCPYCGKKIFDLIRSREFNRDIETICEIHQRISSLHKKDRKHHETSWKEEEKIQKDLIDTYVYVRSAIDAIIHAEPTIDNQSHLESEDGTDAIKEDGNGL